MTTELEGGEGAASRPGRSLPLGKTRYPLYRRLGGPQGRSGQVRKILPPPGFDSRTVQAVASRYTDWATRPTTDWAKTRISEEHNNRIALDTSQLTGRLGARCRSRSWLRHCATNQKVAGSIPDGVIGIFHRHNSSGRAMALGLTQPLIEMSTRNISWGKGGRCIRLTLPSSCADCLELWKPQPPGTLRACPGL